MQFNYSFPINQIFRLLAYYQHSDYTINAVCSCRSRTERKDSKTLITAAL